MRTPFGLIGRKTTSEQLDYPHEDTSVAWKQEFWKLLLDQVQAMLGLLTDILETVWDKHSVTATAPPLSLTSGENGD